MPRIRPLARRIGALLASLGLIGLAASPAAAGDHFLRHHSYGYSYGMPMGVMYTQPVAGVSMVPGVSATPAVGFGTVSMPAVGMVAGSTTAPLQATLAPLQATQFVPLQTQAMTLQAVSSSPGFGVSSFQPAVSGGLTPGLGAAAGTQYVWTLAPVQSGQSLQAGVQGVSSVPLSVQGSDDFRVLSTQVGGPFSEALISRLRQELQRLVGASGGRIVNRELITQALLLIARDLFASSGGGSMFDLVLRPVVERLISRLINDFESQSQSQPQVNPPSQPSDNRPGALPAGRYRIEGTIEITVGGQSGANPPVTPTPSGNELPESLRPVRENLRGEAAPEIP